MTYTMVPTTITYMTYFAVIAVPTAAMIGSAWI